MSPNNSAKDPQSPVLIGINGERGSSIRKSARRSSRVTKLNAISPAPTTSKLTSKEKMNPASSNSSFQYEEVLKGLVVYVEVRSDLEDLSMLFGEHLLYLGATVSRTFNKKVTHVVFKDGKESTFKKAKERNLPVVSVVWIDRCKKQKCHVPEESFIIKEYCTYGKRKRYINSVKYENNLLFKSFEESKKLVESIQLEREREKILAVETPTHSKRNSKFDNTITSPSVIPETVFNPKIKELSVSLSPVEPLKRKLFDQGKSLFLGEPKESTPKRCPLKEANAEKFKSTKIEIKQTVTKLDSTRENDSTQLRVQRQFDTSPTEKLKLRSSLVDTSRLRNSLDDFKLSNTINKTHPERKKMKKDTKTIVLTSFNSSMSDIAYHVVKALGEYQIISTVSKSTTHVICGENKRTLNVLYGLAQGCFLLNPEWLMRSLESGKWLDEGHFELIEYFPSAMVRQNENFNLFKNCGSFFISPDTSPPASDLANLITMCGGMVTTCFRKCSIVVGDYKNCSTDEKNAGVINVEEKLVLDCISGLNKFQA